MKFLMVIVLFLCVGQTSAARAVSKRLCYYPNWAQYRPGTGSYLPEHIDPFLCSHIIYAFAKLKDNKLIPIEWNDQSTGGVIGLYERVNNLKLKNPSLKTLLAVGGWNAGTSEMTKMLATKENRKQFIDHSIAYLRRWKFDGLDLDFEYPGIGDSPPEDKKRMTLLIQEARTAYKLESEISGLPVLLLAVAIPADEPRIKASYELNIIEKSLDFINIMSYDYHGPWERITGHVAPLFSNDSLNVNASATYVESTGVELSKIVIGIVFYGRCYILANPDNPHIGSPILKTCPAGPYTQTPGVLSFYEICNEYLSNPETKIYWSEDQQVTYLARGNEWVGYESETSLTKKLDYIRNKGYGGWMIWDLSFDDFKGAFCNSYEPYPLLKTLNIPSFNYTTVYNPTRTTHRAPTRTPPQLFDCSKLEPGYYPDPTDCTKYIQCYQQKAYYFTCPPQLYFNDLTLLCDWSFNLSEDRRKECNL